MSDFIWFVFIAVLFMLLSLIFIGLGWQIWKKQKMNLIIGYHCGKVSEENKKPTVPLRGSVYSSWGLALAFLEYAPRFSGLLSFLYR